MNKQKQINSDYETYIHQSRYARYLSEVGRRETWGETCDRYVNYFGDKLDGVREDIRKAIYEKDIMPSMRAMMTAGEALDRDNVAGYNCAYLTISRVRAFDELMYILMCGTGVGFSVERQYIQQLPVVAEEFHDSDTTIVVADSKIGWCKALKEVIGLLYVGQIPKWDTSKVRAAGEPLKVFGGRASGPEPLRELFTRLVGIFKNASGRRLSSLECHDVCCYVASSVVVGGVRRSALISLSNLTDLRLRNAKSGQWWIDSPQRAYANNSVAYTEKPDVGIFMEEWHSIYESKSGERGLFSRPAAQKKVASIGRRDAEHDFGTNPCSEIILRDRQFCNLSEVIIRSSDTIDSLRHKVELATICGTLQSTLTDFRYLSPKWRENCEDERLLGVSLTGIMDHKVLSKTGVQTVKWLRELKDVAIETNRIWAKKLGINQSTAITCVKPSGTVSQLCNTASGIHPRFHSHYIRRVRNDAKDPLGAFLVESGVPCEKDPDGTLVFTFPISYDGYTTNKDHMTALEQLLLWKQYAEEWCEHKPSITVYVRDHEWPSVGAWVWENFDMCSGVSFLPHTDHIYERAPYEVVPMQLFNSIVESFPQVNWENFNEVRDNTTSSQEFACTAGACEI